MGDLFKAFLAPLKVEKGHHQKFKNNTPTYTDQNGIFTNTVDSSFEVWKINSMGGSAKKTSKTDLCSIELTLSINSGINWQSLESNSPPPTWIKGSGLAHISVQISGTPD